MTSRKDRATTSDMQLLALGLAALPPGVIEGTPHSGLESLGRKILKKHISASSVERTIVEILKRDYKRAKSSSKSSSPSRDTELAIKALAKVVFHMYYDMYPGRCSQNPLLAKLAEVDFETYDVTSNDH